MKPIRLRHGCASISAVLAACALLAPPALAGACGALSAVASTVSAYGLDYLPRLEFNEPGAGAAACAGALPSVLPGVLEFPVYASNLLDGASGARFRLMASQPIAGFVAAPPLSAEVGPPIAAGGTWRQDVRIAGADLCGPVLLGRFRIETPASCAGVQVDLAGYGGEASPIVVWAGRGEIPAVSPRHGAYAGSPDPYHCQPPLCPEPNLPVTEFAPAQSGGRTIELGWRAGGGNFTVIRYRSDGRPPTSLFDGELLATVPTVPGERYSCLHVDPQVPRYWYAAFAVTMSGDGLALGALLECGAFTTASVDPSVAAEPASWGHLKDLYR